MQDGDLTPIHDGLIVLDHDGVPALVHDGSPPEVMRKRIDQLVQAMLEVAGDDPKPPCEESLECGLYTRKLFIPAGTLLAGRVHKTACMNIVAAGDITVLTEFGLRRLTAGFTGTSPPGIRKIGYANADTIFINVFRTDARSVEEVEEECVFPPEFVHANTTMIEA